MKLGIIADIHGNLQALTQALETLDARNVDLILCAGDLVCYGANPNQVLDLLRECGIPSVIGNYGAAVAWNHPRASRTPSSPMTEPLKQEALDWTKRCVTVENLRYLRGLPWMLHYRLDDLRIQVLHAGLDHLDQALSPDWPEGLADLAARLPADVIILGHTHQAYTYVCDDTVFVNPGAVGRSLNGDTRAAYAILDTTTRQATLHRVAYDVDAAVRAIATSGMSPAIATLIRHGARRIEEVVTV
ncbi:MAG: YfcE family phosphodiesterase [Chloroflexota bacterium]|nr:YfcE family phosphodiesterase [Chloroflexota bacterium]